MHRESRSEQATERPRADFTVAFESLLDTLLRHGGNHVFSERGDRRSLHGSRSDGARAMAQLPAAGIPRTKDGKPNLAAPLPRAANGKPDLSGVWTTDATPRQEMERLFPGVDDLAVPGDDPLTFPEYFLNVFSDYKNEDVPIKPEALEIFLGHAKSLGKDDPTSHCLPAGIPMGDLLPTPRRFIHLPNLLVILYKGSTLSV